MISVLLIALIVTIYLILAVGFALAMVACIAVCKFILAAIFLFLTVLSTALMYYICIEVIDI